MTQDETRKCLQHLLDTVQHLDAQFKEMSRDGLLELWWRQPYNEPAYQYAIIVALKTYHQLDAPLYPYDLQTDKEQFRFLPSALLAETETKVRELVERNAAYAFNIMDQYGFVLEQDMRLSLIENRVTQEMTQNGYTYWKKIRQSAPNGGSLQNGVSERRSHGV